MLVLIANSVSMSAAARLLAPIFMCHIWAELFKFTGGGNVKWYSFPCQRHKGTERESKNSSTYS
jgi:hypothetical protein